MVKRDDIEIFSVLKAAEKKHIFTSFGVHKTLLVLGSLKNGMSIYM